LEDHGQVVALEVKAANTVRLKDGEGLAAFKEAMTGKKEWVRSAILYGGSEARMLDKNCYALPWGWMLPKG
jgi:hypothetical protein